MLFKHRGGSKFGRPESYVRDKDVINGLTEYKLNLKENFKPSEVSMLDLIPTSDGGTRLNFTNQFRPGCVVAVRYVYVFILLINISFICCCFFFVDVTHIPNDTGLPWLEKT